MGRAFHQQRFDVTLYRASLFVCLIFFGGQHTLETDASPVPKVTSVNLASIPATTATTCTLGNSTTPNGHPDSKSSPSNGTTKAEEHDKHAGTTLKLDRMDRLRPAIWVRGRMIILVNR
ncbi:hypothetical protein J3R30DRAFT_3713936 [Lentinula aciculospora]|uniref:Uncharacterized protein n=1 Tax=Lentinula aciculospora TaxID=153920 RepID=A0A9W9DGB7_9AGAR|nr:hypothetical protein J3R30DRAFT_3713936 [Lentinula aciculospora]